MTPKRPTRGFEPTPTPVAERSERVRAIARDDGSRAAQVLKE